MQQNRYTFYVGRYTLYGWRYTAVQSVHSVLDDLEAICSQRRDKKQSKYAGTSAVSDVYTLPYDSP